MIDRRRDEIKLWRDAALGAQGVELVAGQCLKHRYRPHFHEEFVVAVFTHGTHRYQVGRHAGITMTDSVLLIPQGETHAGEAISKDQGWSYRAFYPDLQTLDEMNRELFTDRSRNVFAFDATPLHQDAELARYLGACHRMIERETHIMARQQGFASAMSALLTRYAQPRRAIREIGREPAAIRRAVDCANARFCEPALSVNHLAEAAGLSAYHFMRCFRATLGLTAHQYVLQLRLREARRLLADDLPASQVACAVGFSDQSHLNRHFRTAFGLTPGRYAKETRRRQAARQGTTTQQQVHGGHDKHR